MSVTSINRAIISTALVGILVSTYALYVEMAAEARPGYKALCDLSEHASCTRVLTSEFSKGFGFVAEDSSFEVPNCIYGIVFYCIVIFLYYGLLPTTLIWWLTSSTFDNSAVVRLQQFLCLTSVASCIYLGYLLLFVLFDFCIVCVSMYVANFTLLVFVNKKINLLATKNK